MAENSSIYKITPQRNGGSAQLYEFPCAFLTLYITLKITDTVVEAAYRCANLALSESKIREVALNVPFPCLSHPLLGILFLQRLDIIKKNHNLEHITCNDKVCIV